MNQQQYDELLEEYAEKALKPLNRRSNSLLFAAREVVGPQTENGPSDQFEPAIGRETARAIADEKLYHEGPETDRILYDDKTDDPVYFGFEAFAQDVYRAALAREEQNKKELRRWALQVLPDIQGGVNPADELPGALTLLQKGHFLSIELGSGLSGGYSCKITPGQDINDIPSIPEERDGLQGEASLNGKGFDEKQLSYAIVRAFKDVYRKIGEYDVQVEIFDDKSLSLVKYGRKQGLEETLQDSLMPVEQHSARPDDQTRGPIDKQRKEVRNKALSSWDCPDLDGIATRPEDAFTLLDDPDVQIWWIFYEPTYEGETYEEREQAGYAWSCLPSVFPASLGGEGGEAQGKFKADNPVHAVVGAVADAWEQARTMLEEGLQEPSMHLFDATLETDEQDYDVEVFGPANGREASKLRGVFEQNGETVEVTTSLSHPIKWGVDVADKRELFDAIEKTVNENCKKDRPGE